jgi:hypothetical protein
MPTIALDDEEHAAVTAAVRKAIGRYRHAPRLDPFKSALAKFDPSSVARPVIERPPLPEAPMRSRGGRRTRR